MDVAVKTLCCFNRTSRSESISKRIQLLKDQVHQIKTEEKITDGFNNFLVQWGLKALAFSLVSGDFYVALKMLLRKLLK